MDPLEDYINLKNQQGELEKEREELLKEIAAIKQN